MSSIPMAFIWRRLQSLMGLFLVFFLMEHMLTNSQAALFVGDDGKGFIQGVNLIHSLPYLPAIEIGFLLLPFLIHVVWGIQYLKTSRQNSSGGNGTRPSLGGYLRNHFYTWQRITSYFLILAVGAHVLQMRFMRYPEHTEEGTFKVEITQDEGLQSVAQRLDATVEGDHVIAKDIGTAILFTVRDVMKDPLMMVGYTLLVIFGIYHGFNGLWTFMITWGVNLTPTSQNLFRKLTTGLMLLFGFLGLIAVYGTYWINLRQ